MTPPSVAPSLFRNFLRNKISSIVAFILFSFVLSWPGAVAAAEPVALEMGPEGVASLAWRGTNYWAGGEPAILAFQTASDEGEPPRSLLGKRLDFRSDKSGRVVVDYEGATLTVAFVPRANTLDIVVEILNKTSEPCDWVEVMIGRLNLLNRLSNQPASVGGNLAVDNRARLGMRMLAAPGAVIGLGNWNVREPALVNTGRATAGVEGTPIVISTPRITAKSTHPIVDDRLIQPGRRVIAPGETARFQLSLSFGEPGASIAEMDEDLLRHIRKERPMVLDWPDRRPIGTLFIAQSHTGWPTNPRGYIFGQRDKNDVTTPEGREAFGQALMEYADRSIRILQEMDAQGVIVWDLEGQEMPHQISYVADPRVLKEVAPEMDEFADAFFKKFSDAGFKTGITLRPTRYLKKEGSKFGWTQAEVENPVEDIADRIRYAKDRWGCTIFYLDSNIFNKDWLNEEEAARMKNVPFLLPTAMMEELHRRFPDVLIIPEWSSPAEFTVTAPYASPNLRQRGTTPEIRAVYPEAFSVVMTNRPALEAAWDTYRTNVQGGDILLFLAWYPDPGNELVRLLYEEKELLKQGPPPGIEDPAKLVELAASEDVRTRYFAARSLGEAGDAQAVPALLRLLDDPSPLVQKNAIISLGKRQVSDASLADRMLTIIMDPKSGMLAPFAATTLGSTGATGIEGIRQLLEAPESHRQEQLRQYGLTALSALPGEMPDPLLAPTMALMQSPNPTTAEMAVQVLGEKNVTEAIPALKAALTSDNEFLSLAAVRALGRLGDASSAAPIAALFDRGYRTTATYSIRSAQDEALRRLTGTENSLTPVEWQALINR